jgi:REP-associated tyrosine transposase
MMQRYRKGSHTVYQLHYHFVFIPKYRKPVLRGELGLRVRELVREICRSLEIEIVKGHIRPDHVHLLLSVPPTLAPSRVMQALKGKTSHHLMRDFRTIRRQFWGRHFWARGYFVASSGVVTDEVIAKYIEEQDVESEDEDFKVSASSAESVGEPVRLG